MLQRIFLCIVLKNVLLLVITIGSPVVLNGLNRIIHLIDPFCCRLQVFVSARNYHSSAMEAESVRPGDVNLAIRAS
ncbi:hypothetical protein D3C76_1596010 [compost metagenome]